MVCLHYSFFRQSRSLFFTFWGTLSLHWYFIRLKRANQAHLKCLIQEKIVFRRTKAVSILPTLPEKAVVNTWRIVSGTFSCIHQVKFSFSIFVKLQSPHRNLCPKNKGFEQGRMIDMSERKGYLLFGLFHYFCVWNRNWGRGNRYNWLQSAGGNAGDASAWRFVVGILAYQWDFAISTCFLLVTEITAN